MGLFKEFKEFAVKGNMADMIVGIVIGASFNKVVDVLVKKIIMPPLSFLTDGINFQNKRIVLQDTVLNQTGNVVKEEIAIGYGALFEALIDFFIIGFTIFIVVKFMNRLRSKAQDVKDKTVETPKDIQLLTDLAALLTEQNKILRSREKQ